MILSVPAGATRGEIPEQGDHVERADGRWLVAARVWRADGSVDLHLHLLEAAPEASTTD